MAQCSNCLVGDHSKCKSPGTCTCTTCHPDPDQNSGGPKKKQATGTSLAGR